MRRFLSVFGAVFAIGASAITASAQTNSISLGPIPLSGPDQGTCGNNWANDTLTATFVATVDDSGNGTLTQTDTNGHFVTVAGVSPGACDTGHNNGATVRAGVKGTFSGTLTINVKNATLNPSPQTGGCTGITSDCALKAIFGPNAVVTGASFSAVYTANCGQLLVQSVWHNSSSRNTGDIASKRPGFRAHVTCAKPVVKKAPAKVTTTTTTLAQTGGGLPMAPLAGLLLIGLGGALVLRRKTA